MAGSPAWLSVRDAVDEILKRQHWTAPDGSPPRPRPSTAPSPPAGVGYGNLYAPPLGDLADLRRRQAEFAQTARDLDHQNSWMAIPALAPAALPVLDGLAALGLRAAGAALPKVPLNFSELEAWQRNSRPIGDPLGRTAKTALRDVGRNRSAQANRIFAAQMGAHVHHSEPLEWAHLKPGADPNRLANLWPLPREAHAIATREWAAFGRALKGRVPTQAEIMQAKLRIDDMVAPYLRRPGASVSRLPPNGGPK